MDDITSLENIFAGLMPPASDLSEALSALAFQPPVLSSSGAGTAKGSRGRWVFDLSTPLSSGDVLYEFPSEPLEDENATPHLNHTNAIKKRKSKHHAHPHLPNTSPDTENNNPALSKRQRQRLHLERGARPDKRPSETWHAARARWRIERPQFGGLTAKEMELKDYYLTKIERGETLVSLVLGERVRGC
jgi:hypothetical protein